MDDRQGGWQKCCETSAKSVSVSELPKTMAGELDETAEEMGTENICMEIRGEIQGR